MEVQVLSIDVSQSDGAQAQTIVRLACADASGEPCMVTVAGFRPSVLVAPASNRDTPGWLHAIRQAAPDREVRRLLPLCGFMPRPCACLRVEAATHPGARDAARDLARTLSDDHSQEARVVDAYTTDQLFFAETGVRPLGWIRVPSLHPWITTVEVLDRSGHAPVTECVFDLECHSSTGGFPDPSVPGDCIEMIGLAFTAPGAPPELLCLVRQDGVAALADGGVAVETFGGSEIRMLLAFRDHLVRRRTAVVIGHNAYGFDYPYLFGRLDALLATGGATTVDQTQVLRLSSHWRRPATIRERAMQRQHRVPHCLGVAFLDSMVYFQAMFNLSSYALNALAEHFMQDSKHDLAPGYLFKVFGNDPCIPDLPAARARVADYCVQDVALTLRLCQRVDMVMGLRGLSFVTMTPLQEYLTSGQQIKSYRCIAQKCHQMGYYINKDDLPPPGGSYQGATVLDPSIGFHPEPVLCLDFASLYPSCIIAYNLCYSTIEWRGDRAQVDPALAEDDRDWYVLGDRRVSFVRGTVRRGVVPAVVADLMAERARLKAAMKGQSGTARVVLDKLQLAVKIVQNSIYGFMGVQGKRDAATGAWVYRPMLANTLVAQAVTYNGRQLIECTRRLVTAAHDCEVIYGDTDSAMVKVRSVPPTVRGLRRAFAIGRELAATVTAQFPDPIVLEFETVYWPFVQRKKKHYATCAYESEDLSQGCRVAKGLEVKRRDNAPFLRDMFAAVLQRLTPLVAELGDDEDAGFDANRIQASVRRVVADFLDRLVRGEVPQDRFVVTKQLRSPYAGWAFDHAARQFVPTVPRPPTIQGHVDLANRINQRIAAGVVARMPLGPGDRVPYVVVVGDRGRSVSQRLEDPEWQAIHGPAIDRYHYLAQTRAAVTGICRGVVHLDDLFDAAQRRVPRTTAPGQRSLRHMLLAAAPVVGRKRPRPGAEAAG
ncbi:MAG: DNA polymerase domain-containing protein [Pseudomonadota bacterium]